MEEIENLWKQHLALEFPRGYIAENVEDNLIADLALLDGDVAGGVTSFLWNKGRLDAKGISMLEDCEKDLIALRDLITEQNPKFRTYTDHLLVLARKVLEASR